MFQIKYTEVEIEGHKVNIRKPLFREIRSIKEGAKTAPDEDLYISAELVKAVCCDEAGKPLFPTDDDVNELTFDVFNQLAQAAIEQSGLVQKKSA